LFSFSYWQKGRQRLKTATGSYENGPNQQIDTGPTVAHALEFQFYGALNGVELESGIKEKLL
jgi:hypothetical protein